VTSEPSSATDVVCAQTTLDQLMAWVGVDGLVAALQNPGLLAVVDQHISSIRESIAGAGCEVDAVSLSRYAKSVLAVAARHGGLPPDPDAINWRDADWYVMRLVAICALAESEECL
jgi:hypothetical protein